MPIRLHAVLVPLSALALAVGVFRTSIVASPQPAPSNVDFTTQIEPLLREHCYECHGEKKARGKLRLHVRDLALKGGGTGPLLVPGDSAKSYLLQRVRGEGDEDRMPLDKPALSDEQIALLAAWVDQGAAWPVPGGDASTPEPTIVEHWSYVAPVKGTPPAVSNEAWVRTPIDRFVLARLDQEKLLPSHEASRETLLRRVTLDLTGLPPTIEEIDAFLADTRPDAYERVVDRLLASPHFGERWARLWLDLARYADSNGYEKDRLRSMWPYRDWVITAFNDDMPFDRFTIEQIAGDMLPDATPSQRIASGFHRNAMTNEEGGVDPDESLYEVQVDRTNTTATVWLGSTLACAQCHNHKYDPFSQKDYFRLLAFFGNPAYRTEVLAGDGTRYIEGVLDLATPEQDARRRELRDRLTRAEAALATSTPERDAAQAAWERQLRDVTRTWTPLVPSHATATNGVELQVNPDGRVKASGPNPESTTYTVEARADGTVTGLRLEALLDEALPRGGPGRDPYGHFRLTRFQVYAAPAQSPDARAPVAFTVAKSDGNVNARDLIEITRADAEAASATALPGARLRPGWGVDAVRDGWRVNYQLVLVPEAPITHPRGTMLTIVLGHDQGTLGQGIGHFRLSTTSGADPLEAVSVSARTRAAVETPAAKRTPAQVTEVATRFREQSPLFKADREAVADLRKAIDALDLPSTLVMEEAPTWDRPSAVLRERGAFTSPGARVYANTPSVLPPLGDDLPPNRLGLARWLVRRDNPLTARVTVNRFWEALFGRGLVETSEDFGTRGTPPSHPELLDWLAVEFMDQGWRLKPLLRRLVLSATYRQDSHVSPDLQQRDPYNRLLARGPRFRMEAEMVRDVALAASGQLVPKVGGPSVFPPQPPGIWNNAYDGGLKWIENTGDDRYRRSLYTFLRRTAPYPLYATFDATSREFCTVRRVRTNTPLQALATLNDAGFFEHARALGDRLRSHPGDVNARLDLGMRLATGRRATPQEIARLRALLDQARTQYTHDTALLKDAGGDADRAAWTIVGNVLLNLDETVTKG